VSVNRLGLGLALKVDLGVLVELLFIGSHTSIEDRVEAVAVGASEVKLHELGDLRLVIDLVGVERRDEIMELVWVGFVTENHRPEISVECRADRFGVIDEIEHEDIVLLRIRTVSRDMVCTAFIPDNGLSTYIVCSKGSS
jgi:hypothetical protein